MDQITDLTPEFIVEPGNQPSHLGAHEGRRADQRRRFIDIFEIFQNGARAGDHGAVRLDQNRDLAGRVEREEFDAALPGFLQHQFKIEALLGQGNADSAAGRSQPEMIKGPHDRQSIALQFRAQ